MGAMWENARLPRVADWFQRVRARPTFKAALLDWISASLRDDLIDNGTRSWPDVRRIIEAA